MPGSLRAAGQSRKRKLQRFAIEDTHEPSHWSNEPRTIEPRPSHGLRPVEVMNHSRQNLAKDLFGCPASFDLLCRQVLALGCLNEIDFVQRYPLLLSKAHRSPC